MRDRPLTPIEKGEAQRGGYWCLPCNNAWAIRTENIPDHECTGPCTIGGRNIRCTCQEHK